MHVQCPSLGMIHAWRLACQDLSSWAGQTASGLCVQVAVNVPLSDKTCGVFNSETIGKMKKSAVLVR